MTESKACRGCGETKPIDAYARKGKYRQARCKDCSRQWAARYRAEHGDRVNANARSKYAADPTKKKASKAAYYDRHREEIHARRRAWFAKVYPVDPSVWRAAHDRRKQRVTANMDALDRALSVDYRRAIAADPCHYCGQHANEMHNDHFVPLAKGGTDHWWNLVRSCATCNLTKNNRCGTWFALKKGSARESLRAPALP